MSNMTSSYAKRYSAQAAIPKHRIFKFGASDAQILVATSPNDALIGVTTELAGVVDLPCDGFLMGLPPVEYGGPVTRGDWLTSDAVGRAVLAAPAAGVNANVIGRALVSGVLGDLGTVLLAPGRIQG